ncbi:blue light receptor [Rhizophlyctis rosea]|uniref:Blue light receptor n=1 Tax=Rhizophlyctis rosea TaxID=64517 RepID=A0AAD5S731_9FUNG|nr:blue light receptor [Rhizophlyctis rosea]
MSMKRVETEEGCWVLAAGTEARVGSGVDEVLDLRIENLRLRRLVEEEKAFVADGEVGEGLEDGGVVEEVKAGADDAALQCERMVEDGEEHSHPFLKSQRYAHLLNLPGAADRDGESGPSSPEDGMRGGDGSVDGGSPRRKVSMGSSAAIAAEEGVGAKVEGEDEDCGEMEGGNGRRKRGRDGGGMKVRRKKKVKTIPNDFFCRQCGTTRSPEWRKGPEGPKTLCNACGLAYAKKNKKSGEVEERRGGVGGGVGVANGGTVREGGGLVFIGGGVEG